MSTAFLIYLVMQLDNISDLIAFFTTISFCVAAWAVGFNVMAWNDASKEEKQTEKGKQTLDCIVRIRKKAVVVFITLVFITTLVPSTKTAIYMIGGGATIEALQSPEAKEIGGKVLEILQKKLDEELGK